MSISFGLTGKVGTLPPTPEVLDFRWYAVYTRSRFEKRVASTLTERGVENYLPLVPEIHRWKDRRMVVEQPLFPSYVFARFQDYPKSRIQILSTVGAVQILGTASRIEPIPDSEIESIRCLLNTNVPCSKHPFLREGVWVRVKHGPLMGLEGILVRLKSRARLVLSVNLLSSSVATELNVDDVEVVRTSSEELWPRNHSLFSLRVCHRAPKTAASIV